MLKKMEDKLKWNLMSNSEIKVRQETLKFEYDKVKNDMIKLYDHLSILTEEYLNGEKELKKRNK